MVLILSWKLFYEEYAYNSNCITFLKLIGVTLRMSESEYSHTRTKKMKTVRKQFLRMFESKYPEHLAQVREETDSVFRNLQKDVKFSDKSQNPMDKRMPDAAYLLAVIKVMNTHGYSYELIKDIILAVAKEIATPKNRFQLFMKSLAPNMLTSKIGYNYLKRIKSKMAKFPEKDGFEISILTKPSETLEFGFGIDVLECGICKLFSKHNYQQFTPILCEVDYITSSMAGLELIRTGTIANGAKKCDFRYKKVSNN